MPQRDSIKTRLTTAVENILDRATTLTDPGIAAAAKSLGVELDSLSILRAERAFRDAVASIHAALDSKIGARSNRRAVHDAERLVDALEVVGLSPEERRQRLISEFRIVTGRWKVTLDLGESTPLRFLQRANEVSEICFGTLAVQPSLVDYWKRWPELGFCARVQPHSFVGVNGYVPRSFALTRNEHGGAGCLDVPLFRLAVAHAAYRLVTNSDLFHGYAVRAREGTVLLDAPRGLEAFLGISEHTPKPIGGALLLTRVRRRGEGAPHIPVESDSPAPNR